MSSAIDRFNHPAACVRFNHGYREVNQADNQAKTLSVNNDILEFDTSDEDCDEEFSDYEDLSATISDGVLCDRLYHPDIDSEVCDMTKQLLDFTEMVNADIQKYFGKKNDPDSCDIYENKWVTTKSGRELYYADLLRLAQGEVDDTKENNSDSNNSKRNKNKETCEKHTGNLDKSLGLGPLNDLFEVGLKRFLLDGCEKKSSKKMMKRLKNDMKKYNEIVPMQKRKLPESFWKEPRSKASTRSTSHTPNTHIMSTASKTPDFSDLLQSWGDEGVNFTESVTKGSHQTIPNVHT